MIARLALAALVLAVYTSALAGEAPDKLTGERLWVKPGSPLRVCPRPGHDWLLQTGCVVHKSGSFTVGNAMMSTPRLAGLPPVNIGYRVTFPDGAAGWVSETDLIFTSKSPR